MKPIIRYRSQLLFRKSFGPKRSIRLKPGKVIRVVFGPARGFGCKPRLEIVP